MSIDSLINVLLIVFGFGLLIGIHELGHFLAAKWSGIRTNVFAIGMGPVVCSYRKGVGFSLKSSKEKLIAKYGKDAVDMSDAELAEHGLSETEYSLRFLPIGGFVSMLGQEDGKPDAVSDDVRSFNSCPIGKRMIVVSAGVIMNLLLAGVFFLICFQVGVNFEAPIIGQIIPGSPAQRAVSLGESKLPLRSGDTVLSVNGSPTRTFNEIQIAGAMSKPNEPVVLKVQRENQEKVLTYSILPETISQDGLLELGLYPAASLTIRDGQLGENAISYLRTESPQFAQLKPGMHMTRAGFKQMLEAVDFWSAFDSIVQKHGTEGQVNTQWSGDNEATSVSIPVYPVLELMRPVGIRKDAPQNFEHGFLGLTPLPKITAIVPDSQNSQVLQEGDVILRVGSHEALPLGQLRNLLVKQSDGSIELTVLRNSQAVELVAQIQSGKLGIYLVNALEIPMIAQPLQEILVDEDEVLVQMPTPVVGLQLLGGSTVLSINGKGIHDWSDIRDAIIQSDRLLAFTIQASSIGHRVSTVTINLTQQQRSRIANLGWTTPLSEQMFEPIYVVRSSGGNPLKALQMGFDETLNMVVMTYLTIDRLFRRSVGVEQLRGPIGIVHIGARIADRGFSYLLFFLAIISVNLAVLNFLPLPIVDGGLFLYLIYEKLIGKPPSIAFQNAVAVLGLGLIGMLFVVTFYNDIVRLVG